MESTLIVIALISGGFPTIGLIVTTIVNAKNRVKDIQTTTKLELYKENMIKRQNAYQSIVSTARDLGTRFTTCIYVFSRSIKNESLHHDGLDYEDKNDFFYRYFLCFFNDYKNIEKNNIIYSSNKANILLKELTQSIFNLGSALANIGNGGFIIRADSRKTLEGYRESFDNAFDKYLSNVFDENESLIVKI
jgi:hypothetical protein